MKKKEQQIKKRKIPMRRELVSGQMLPKKDMIRIVRTPEDKLVIDPSGRQNGRGAYLAIDGKLAKRAKKEKVLDSVFQRTVPDEFYDQIIDYVVHQQARRELFSHERIIKTENS
ncbi:RNase P modulator RnpM [Oenococcus alcoholitolerans]|uniref:YlxR domain-containing protein n=1 Tax=Oenococcus alcoholitolerans TaxID=931074 RepID=A0ABR4XPV4_9LACO|nr:hypothetical protein Q757_07055 [Oenococcus alcoholitolerans]